MAEELFSDFSLDGDDNILNSLDSETSGAQATETATAPVDDDLTSELQDFKLDETKEELPIADTTTNQPTDDGAGETPQATTEQPTTPTEDNNPPANNEQVTSLYAPLASDLHKQGVLPEEAVAAITEAEDPQEAFYAAMQGQIDAGIESFVTSLPEKFKQQLIAYNQGVDLDVYGQQQAQTLKLESITEDQLKSDTSLQKRIAKSNLLSKGFTEEKANKYIENWESLNELEAEALDAHKEELARSKANEEALVQQAEQQRQLAEQQRVQTINNMQKTIEDTEEIIPGKRLNKISREKILNSMTQIVGKDQNGNPMNAVMATRAKNPIDFEMKLHYLHSLGVFDGKWDDIVKTAKTKAVSELDTKLKEVYNFHGKSAGNATVQKDGDSVLDIL
jgi:hypothetical protein